MVVWADLDSERLSRSAKTSFLELEGSCDRPFATISTGERTAEGSVSKGQQLLQILNSFAVMNRAAEPPQVRVMTSVK